MIKETITYTDYEGQERTDDFWFHLNKPEIYALFLSKNCDLESYMRRIIAKNEGSTILEFFEKVISTAFGEKSIDGKSFVKTEEATRLFMQSAAYDELFTKLVTDADAASKFMNGVISTDYKNKK